MYILTLNSIKLTLFNSLNIPHIDILIKTLDKYHLLYFNNINEKHALILRYNNHRSGIKQREIQRWQLDRYRLYYEVDYIRHFIYILTTITNEHIFGNTIEPLANYQK